MSSRGLVSFTLVWAQACARPTPAVAPTPSEHEPTPVTTQSSPSGAEPMPMERRLAAYRGGSSCRLVLHGRALFWISQSHSTSEPASEVPGASPGGAALRCSETRGAIHRVSIDGGDEIVIAQTEEWPFGLRGTDEALYYQGYCSHGLWTVPIAGGTPRRIGRVDATVSDHFTTPKGVIFADRFGTSTGVFRIEPARDQVQLVAAKGRKPWLMGALGDDVYWAELDGSNTGGIVFAAKVPSDRKQVGRVHGMPMDVVVRGDDLFVLTTRAVMQLTGKTLRELSVVSSYGDRGSLAVDDHHLYWANGREGTVSRLGRDGGDHLELEVGGEPCGVAVDEDSLYWLDRGRRAVMRAPLARFDTIPASRPEPPELVDPSPQGVPAGLDLRLEAKPVRLANGWGVDLKLHAHVWGLRPFDLGSVPAPHLNGTIQEGGHTISSFGDGCRAGKPAELGPGARRTFTRRYGEGVAPGRTLVLEVGLCDVGSPDGSRHTLRAGTVVLDVPLRGRPEITVTPSELP